MTKSSIKLSKWNNDLSVGVDAIDNDHKKLFSILRQIKQAIESKKAPTSEVIDKLLSDLYVHTDLHFNREEILMKVCAYPHYENHCHVHELIRNQVKHYLDNYQSSQSILHLKLLLAFMELWLIDHIGTMDKSYSSSMTGKESLIEKANSLFEATWRRDHSQKESGEKLKLLVVDDEEDICNAICTHARRLNHDAIYITEATQFANSYSDKFNVRA